MASFLVQLNKPSPERLNQIWILMNQEMMGWQWHQLDHMQIICTSLQTHKHASTSSLIFFIGQMLFLMPNQQCQSTEGKFFWKIIWLYILHDKKAVQNAHAVNILALSTLLFE